MSVQRLPLRITPVPSESLVGFLIRLAERNGVQNPQSLASSIGSPFTKLEAVALGPFDLRPMSDASGVEVQALASMTYWPTGHGDGVGFLGEDVGAEMISLKHRRACPKCLSETPFHRAIWDLRLSSACPMHELHLIDRCHDCGRYLRWQTPSITRCVCGADIRRADAAPVPSAELEGLRYVYGALGIGGYQVVQEGPLATLSFGDALSLLLHLGWFASGGRQQPGPVLISRRDLSPHRYLQMGLEVCLDWPTSFYRYLDGLCERSSARYWRATRIRLLTEWAADPVRSEAIQRLLLPLFQIFMDGAGDPRVVYRLERVLMSKLVPGRYVGQVSGSVGLMGADTNGGRHQDR